MKEERDPSYEQDDILELVVRFEKMMRDDHRYFFDVDDFEGIMDFYLERGNINSAMQVLDVAKSQHPTTLDFTMREAELMALTNRPARAMDILSRIESIESHNPEFYLTKASVQSQMGAYRDAIKNLKAAIRFANDAMELDNIYMSLAFEYQNLDDSKQAIHYLEKTLSVNPRNEDALYEMMYCIDQSGAYETGIRFFQEFLNKHPYNHHAWYNLGNLYSNLDLLEKAIDAFDYAIVINEDFLAAQFNKAGTLSRLERHYDAVEVYTETLKNDSSDAITYYYIGECYEKANEYDKALTNYKSAINCDPYLADAWLGIGVVMDYQNQVTEGIHYIKKAIGLDQENPDYWFILGEVERKLGFIDDAKYSFEKVVLFDSKNIDIWLDYSDMLVENEMAPEAIEVILRGLNLHPKNSQLLYRLTAYYLQTGNSVEAFSTLKEALELQFEQHTTLFEYLPVSRNNPQVLDLIESYKNH